MAQTTHLVLFRPIFVVISIPRPPLPFAGFPEPKCNSKYLNLIVSISIT